ncbi:MAG: hypothetical protein OXI91_07660 [Chloroflexota bacterium]|nr:hypothetical protein [Chloroflexota bacterium]
MECKVLEAPVYQRNKAGAFFGGSKDIDLQITKGGVMKAYLLSIFLVTVVLVMACGPAAPARYNEPAGIVVPPTAAPQQDPQLPPTEDPNLPPPGWPTEDPNAFIPTNTPRPTLEPESPEAEAELAEHLAAGEAEAAVITNPAIAAKQEAKDFSLKYSNEYSHGAIVRAEVTGHRMVQPDFSVTWPDRLGNPPFYPKLDTVEQDSWWENQSWPVDKYAPMRRSKLNIKETYYGSLPQGYEVEAPDFARNRALDVGKEYILYVVRWHAAEGELPEATIFQRYNEDQLAAIGGPGGLLLLGSNWAIEGETAWQITEGYMLEKSIYTPTLSAAKSNGVSMPLAGLEKAIEAGVANE